VHFAYVVQDGRGGEATGTVYVTISENVTPSNMVFIPSAGTQFIMGDNNRVGSNANQEPAHTVKFTYSFYLDKYEVSWSLWKSVYSWALAHGYTFEEYAAKGKGDDYPVYGVGWIDCLKWLNARSEMEGLTPVYYTSASHTSGNVVRSGLATSIPPENCIKDGNGWRLPTEAEWEYAARGGVQSYYPYPGTSPDPRYATYTPNTTWCKVADNLPGNFGLYNMAGDVYEWCYELFYQYTSATQTDPWLPGTLLSSKDHISRGGNFMSEAWRTACCARKPYSDNWSRTKDINDLQHGFRCARTTVD
jgi:formylglycine-generating enzyme required for sulfatase activity